MGLGLGLGFGLGFSLGLTISRFLRRPFPCFSFGVLLLGATFRLATLSPHHHLFGARLTAHFQRRRRRLRGFDSDERRHGAGRQRHDSRPTHSFYP